MICTIPIQILISPVEVDTTFSVAAWHFTVTPCFRPFYPAPGFSIPWSTAATIVTFVTFWRLTNWSPSYFWHPFSKSKSTLYFQLTFSMTINDNGHFDLTNLKKFKDSQNKYLLMLPNKKFTTHLCTKVIRTTNRLTLGWSMVEWKANSLDNFKISLQDWKLCITLKITDWLRKVKRMHF